MATEASSKRSAGVVIVRRDDTRFLYLLLRAYRNWDFPKGRIEPGEAPLAAAQREVREETGIAALEFAWGDVYIDTEPYAGGKISRYYLARTDEATVVLGINPTLGRAEHHEYRWLTYEDARQRLVPRLCAVIDWAHALVMSTR